MTNPIMWCAPQDEHAAPNAKHRWVGYFIPCEHNHPSVNMYRSYDRSGQWVDFIISVTVPKMPIHAEWQPLDDDTFIHVMFLSNTPMYMTIKEINEMYDAIREAKRKIHQEVSNNINKYLGEIFNIKS